MRLSCSVALSTTFVNAVNPSLPLPAAKYAAAPLLATLSVKPSSKIGGIGGFGAAESCGLRATLAILLP